MPIPDANITALIELHRGLDRQGPGDETLSRQILSELPALREDPRIADLGCGSGAAALLLAEWFQSTVIAVDVSREFIEELKIASRQHDLDHLITVLVADMGSLDWSAGSIDLLWSEGAAYNLGFKRALELWKPLIADGGLAVISELCWFTPDAPEPAKEFWKVAYPGMESEQQNLEYARERGYSVFKTYRLPSAAWWNNYYNPLKHRIELLRSDANDIMQKVIEDTETEIDLFGRFSESYGYTFYVLKV